MGIGWSPSGVRARVTGRTKACLGATVEKIPLSPCSVGRTLPVPPCPNHGYSQAVGQGGQREPNSPQGWKGAGTGRKQLLDTPYKSPKGRGSPESQI